MFNAIFRQKGSKKILQSFLNNVLKLDIESPDDITIENSEMIGSTACNKSNRLDIGVGTANNEYIDLEMQFQNSGDIKKRSVYYTSKLLIDQLGVRKSHNNLGRAEGSNDMLAEIIFLKILTLRVK